MLFEPSSTSSIFGRHGGYGLKVAMVFALLIASTVSVGDASKTGSWFVDALKYHISTHGQISCQDCHADIVNNSIHPDPAFVSRNPRESFKSEKCFNCHEAQNIKENLEKGLHGGKSIKRDENYSNCIACHDPHYQAYLSKKPTSRLASLPQRSEPCAACHEKKEALPRPSADNARCFECHGAISSPNNEKTQSVDRLCLSCHGDYTVAARASVTVPLIDSGSHLVKGHRKLDCLSCHSQAAGFKHNRQPSADCRKCHTPHDEATIHDAHSTVTCQACHLSEIKPSRNPETGKAFWNNSPRTEGISHLNIIRPAGGKDSCGRCHHTGNDVGAAAIILPAKSIICMPCHAATFSIKDVSSILAILGFAFGMCAVASVWISGMARPKPRMTTGFGLTPAFSIRLGGTLKAMFLDGLLQRRLFRQSTSRWLIHGLIVWPMMLRFTWGLVALVGSLAWPAQDWVWKMLDKNYSLTAFFFDFTGLAIICGIILAVISRRFSGDVAPVKGLPERDWLGVGLFAAIIVVGFVPEGARIALSPATGGAHFAFIGWALSFLWSGTAGLDQIYGYVWVLACNSDRGFSGILAFQRLVSPDNGASDPSAEFDHRGAEECGWKYKAIICRTNCIMKSINSGFARMAIS